jgi:hypothetical protein
MHEKCNMSYFLENIHALFIGLLDNVICDVINVVTPVSCVCMICINIRRQCNTPFIGCGLKSQ